MNEALTAVADAQAMPAGGEQQQIAANAGEVEQTELENDNEVVEGEEGEGEGEQLDPELADVEYEGKAYKLPPELKDALLRTADYTRKTQEVAEQRKSYEAKMAEAQANYQTSQEVIEARAVIHHLDSQLKQYNDLTPQQWQQLESEDPMAAMSHWRQFQQLKDQRGQVAQYLDKTQNDLSEKAKQATADRLRETRAFAEKELKGWSPDLDNKITEFATKDLGFSLDSLRDQYTPQVYRTLYLAHIGHLALQKQTAAPKPSAPAAQPLNKVTARANPPPTGLDDRLSQDEWLKRRNAQIAKRG